MPSGWSALRWPLWVQIKWTVFKQAHVWSLFKSIQVGKVSVFHDETNASLSQFPRCFHKWWFAHFTCRSEEQQASSRNNCIHQTLSHLWGWHIYFVFICTLPSSVWIYLDYFFSCVSWKRTLCCEAFGSVGCRQEFGCRTRMMSRRAEQKPLGWWRIVSLLLMGTSTQRPKAHKKTIISTCSEQKPQGMNKWKRLKVAVRKWRKI